MRIEIPRIFYITDREKRYLSLIAEAQKKGERDLYGYVSRKELIASGTVRNAMYRLRKRFEQALVFVDEYRVWRKKIVGRRII